MPETTTSEERATAEKPFVSVIIPVYNDLDRLCDCVAALEAQTYPADRYEIIVVDNASTTPVAPVLERFPHATAEYEPQPGSYAARNRGIAAARGDIFAFTDSDCIPSPRWIESGVDCLERDQAPIAGGRIDVFPRYERAPTAVELYEMLYAFPQEENIQQGFTVTANLFSSRWVFEQLGPFDQGLKSFGDVDWTSRAVQRGYKLAYCDEASVRHPARRGLLEVNRRYARFAGGHYTKGRNNPSELRHMRLRALQQVKPPLKLTRRLIGTSTPGSAKDKLKILAIGAFVRWSYVIEWIRLELGARPRR